MAGGLVFLAGAALLPVTRAHAHVVYGTRTFYQMTVESDLVVCARITDGQGVVVFEDPPLQRHVVTARVLEVLRGDMQAGAVITFAQHGHGVAEYADGDAVVLFLENVARVPELAGTRLAERVRWVSRQEPQDRVPLAPPTGDTLVAAIRAYAALGNLDEPAERLEGLRRVTVRLLGSRDSRLAASAARDLVLAADAPIVTPADMPVLDPLIDDPRIAIGTRIALLAELDRRGLVSGPERWARLLRDTPPPDLLPLVRAVGAHPSVIVTAELVKILEGRPPELAAAAAVSLGAPHNDQAVKPLASALGSNDERVRLSAIRGLGGIGTADARQALEHAAASHPDPATRRRARAEVVGVSRRQPPAAAPGTGVAVAHDHGAEPKLDDPAGAGSSAAGHTH